MINLLIRHTIVDYAKWRAGFDAHEAARRAAGATGVSQVYRDVENPNQITAMLEWNNAENARKFANDPALKEVMHAAGVTSAPEAALHESRIRPRIAVLLREGCLGVRDQLYPGSPLCPASGLGRAGRAAGRKRRLALPAPPPSDRLRPSPLQLIVAKLPQK